MADLNRASLMGRLGADPEIRSLTNGDKVASLRIATGERWKDKQSGEKKERTEWHSVVVFGPLVNTVERFLTKGGRVLVEGAIRTRKWQDQSGNDRYSTEIVVSGFSGRVDVIDWPEGSGGGAARGQEDAYGDLPGSRGGSGGGTYDQSPDGYGSGGGGGAGGGYGSGKRSDIDDEIPFAPEVR
jgi:single-strand DNA-binding protein